ncbi:hypothetical protein C2845_PM17G05650 [Panicum miliaceum]|uniref:Core Histone H2A/H2B/H3 domain-containing protein n=1 Tax=Panicum miliaceum TaxID=4540 RepID=A0A3L6Q0S2_PANMI|nr:hypothetical protein C2845_PM17G05650 [Panicum miliaceum]
MPSGSKGGAGCPQELHGSPPTPLPSLQQQELDEFWRKIVGDIENTVNFNNHTIPMSSVVQIIREHQGGLMMSSETPSVVTKVLEIFVEELTVRAWMCAKSHDRSSILESDIYEAINSSESYVCLNDVRQRAVANHDQASMSSTGSQLQQEPHFVAATSKLIEDGPTDHPYKSGEEASQIPEDNPAPTTSAEPDEDLNMPTTSSGGTEETK